MKRMTLIRRKINPKYDPYLAFAIAFGIAMLSFGIISLLPGGSRLPIISDLKSEYYVFLMAARKTILSGESLQYSWNIGMGPVSYTHLYAEIQKPLYSVLYAPVL